MQTNSKIELDSFYIYIFLAFKNKMVTYIKYKAHISIDTKHRVLYKNLNIYSPPRDTHTIFSETNTMRSIAQRHVGTPFDLSGFRQCLIFLSNDQMSLG